MKKAQIQIIVLIAIIAAGCIYLFFANSSNMYTLPEYENIATENFTKITIEKQDSTRTIEKTGDDWFIMPEKYKADPATMNTMINKISDFTLSELISTTKQYSKYGLDEENKTTVTAYNGDDILRTFEYGKESSSFQHTFVKMTDDPDIYQVRGNMPDSFDISIDSLRDKSVLSFNAEDILIFTIKMNDGTEITLNKTFKTAETTEETAEDEGPEQEPEQIAVWSMADGTEFKSTEIETLIQTLSTFKCNSYTEEGIDLGELLFSISLKGTTEYSLNVYNMKDTFYPAESSMNDYTFYLASWQVENASQIFTELIEQE